MDPATIAAGLVGILAPFMKGLLGGFKDSAQQAGEAAGGKLRELAVGLWNRIHPKVAEKPAAADAAEQVAANPDDEDSLTVLRVQLKRLLEEDAALLHDLGGMLERAQTAGVISDVVVYGDLKADRGGVVVGHDVHGDVNTAAPRADE